MLRFVPLLIILLGPFALHAQPLGELRHEAAQAMRSQDWQRAATLYEELTKASPHDGALWRSLGLAQLRSGRQQAAIDAYTRAGRTGIAPSLNHYDIACAHALGGRHAQALEALQRAYESGFAHDALARHDSDLKSLHDNARFRDLVGLPHDEVKTRRERWTRDLEFLARRVREVHWQPFAQISEEHFTSTLQEILASLSQMSDLEIRLAVQRLLASMGDGHTSVVSDFFLLHHGDHGPPAGHGAASQRGPAVRFLPLEFFWYEDGVRVVAATEAFQSLLGARLVRVGNLEVEAACRQLEAYVSRDNEWGARWGTMQALADPKTLTALGHGSLDDGFPFVFEHLDATLQTVTLQAQGAAVLQRQRLHTRTAQPLRYRDKQQHLWMQSIEAASQPTVLYARIDGIRDGAHESFEEFTQRLFDTAEHNQARTLVLDLRDNLGGQGHLSRSLLHRILASPTFNRDGGLYVLVGRKTFSAAMALTAQLELHTAARFVGEPTGSRPNFVGETTLVRLPYSGLSVSVSSRYHQNGGSNDQRFWIAPDLPASPDFAAAQAGVDPAIEAVMAEVRHAPQALSHGR